MMSRIVSLRCLALVASLVGGAIVSADTAEAGGCHPSPRVVYVPVQPVYVQATPVVRKVIVVHPSPVYRPSCH